MPLAVGGYDIPGRERRWRRPNADIVEAEPLQLANPYWEECKQLGAARVKLYDIVRTLPQRIDAQDWRHWGFVPGLWNLYFREQVNLGTSLGAISRGSSTEPQDQVDQDVAMAAAELYEKLHTWHYRTQVCKRRRVDGDMTKLRFAEGVTVPQRRLLADFGFRTRQIAGHPRDSHDDWTHVLLGVRRQRERYFHDNLARRAP